MVEHEENIKKEESAKATIETSDKDKDASNSKWKHLRKTLTNSEILAQAVVFLVNISHLFLFLFD